MVDTKGCVAQKKIYNIHKQPDHQAKSFPLGGTRHGWHSSWTASFALCVADITAAIDAGIDTGLYVASRVGELVVHHS